MAATRARHADSHRRPRQSCRRWRSRCPSVSCSASHLAAVFGPTLGTPGTLSTNHRSSVKASRASDRANAKLVETIGLVELLVAHRVDQCHTRRNQLRQSLSPVEISVSMPAASACLASVPMTSSASTPSIINSGQPCDADQFVQRRDLRDERVGHRRAIRLVFRIPLVAKRLARRVEHDREVVRLAVLDQSAQH